MKYETEILFRTIASSDETITHEDIDVALYILQNRDTNNEPLISILRPKEIAKLLNVSKRSVTTYANQGLLMRVYGAGKVYLGISRESYIRFVA